MTDGWGCPTIAGRKRAQTKAGITERSESKMCKISDVDNARNWLKTACHCAHLRTVIGRALEYSDAVENAGLSPEAIAGQDLYEFLTDERVRAAFVKHFPQPTL